MAREMTAKQELASEMKSRPKTSAKKELDLLISAAAWDASYGVVESLCVVADDETYDVEQVELASAIYPEMVLAIEAVHRR